MEAVFQGCLVAAAAQVQGLMTSPCRGKMGFKPKSPAEEFRQRVVPVLR